MIRSGFQILATSLVLALPGWADTIHLVDGDPIEDVTIEEETITSVTYKRGSSLDSVPSERVSHVTFERLPDELDEGESYVQEGDLAGGLDAMREYLDPIMEGGRARKAWAPPYAAKRVIDLSRSIGDLDSVKEVASWLIKEHSESRYVPEAYIAKADAQARTGSADAANKTLQDFRQIVTDRGLSARWRLECDLALILTDPTLKGDSRRSKLKEIETGAGEFPGVQNRARLDRAESLVLDATSSNSDRAKLLAEARGIFQELADDDYTSDEVRAGAYTGLGDCTFFTPGADKDAFKEAGMSYMRVAVLYREQSRYVAKAMFYAGRCFDQRGDLDNKGKARRLYRTVMVEFPSSNWAKEAKNFM